MPCTITGSFEGDRALFAQEDRDKAQKEAIKVTRLLCKLMKDLESNGINMEHISKDVMKWWKKHKEIDKKRKIK